MKKTMTAILLASTVFLTGCYTEPNKLPSDNLPRSYSKVCLQGVAYWKRIKALAPVFTADSTVETCSLDTENTKK